MNGHIQRQLERIRERQLMERGLMDLVLLVYANTDDPAVRQKAFDIFNRSFTG